MSATARETERIDSTRELRRQLSLTFARTADVLEHSAQLADEHAARQAHDGQPDQSATERELALRARRAAQRARANAAHLAQPATWHDSDVIAPDAPRAPDVTATQRD